jgi:hypothetical protein
MTDLLTERHANSMKLEVSRKADSYTVKMLPNFMKPETSFRCSQKHTIGPYNHLIQPSSYFHTFVPKLQLLLSSHLRLDPLNGILPSDCLTVILYWEYNQSNRINLLLTNSRKFS